MQINLKLFAMLADHLPPGAVANTVTIALPEGSTLQTLIERFSLPPNLVHLVLVNGVYVPPRERLVKPLKEGDQIAIWPPVAGG